MDPNIIKEINRYIGLINQCNQANEKMRSIYDELKNDYEKCQKNIDGISKVVGKLEELDRGRESSLKKMEGIANVSFAKNYCDSMRDINQGAKRNNAYNNISDVSNEMKSKMNNLLAKMDDVKREFDNNINKIDEYRRRITQLERYAN